MNKNFFVLIIFGIFLIGVVSAVPSFKEGTYNLTYYYQEDSIYSFNFSSNISNAGDISLYRILNITSTYHSLFDHSDYSWFPWNDTNFEDSTLGMMKINSTSDNETGNFTLHLYVKDGTDDIGLSVPYKFIINATNDAPNFTLIQTEYNLTEGSLFSEYLNASDEENHFPLSFNLTFSNCNLSSWSSKSSCNLFNLTSDSNTSALMSFTPTREDAGVYYVNISVMDNGENYTCDSGYCAPDYSENKTTYFYQLIKFNVFTTLSINVSDCENKVFYENVASSCQINITSKGIDDSLRYWTNASFRNYLGSVSNSSWFYSDTASSAENYTKSVFINITPNKNIIGNWSINFTTKDLTFGENSSSLFYVSVLRNSSLNDAPDIVDVSNLNTSLDKLTQINLTVYDEDLLIPDKVDGYNETTNFTLKILNSSDLSQELTLSDFSVEVLNMPVANTNRTEARIEITPISSDVGYYTINITVNDRENAIDYTIFNFSIIDNTAPEWNITDDVVHYTGNEDSEFYLNLSENVSDSNGDSLTFSYENYSQFNSFLIDSGTGIVNFTPNDFDVGEHILNITVTDPLGLSATKQFNLTIYNINDTPYIKQDSLSVDNATVSGLLITTQEDNQTAIYLNVYDEDFKIPSGQKSFYNENFTFNLTIQGANTNLFNFSISSYPDSSAPNKTILLATFTANKSDIGNYNISLNVTDESNLSDYLEFNITISEVDHNPVLMNLSNFTTTVMNSSFYYRINASDTEDGETTATGGNTNFTFSYNFLSGTDFISSNESIFNTTTGEMNFTFNDTSGGKYHLNITVNDSSGLEDSQDFWIYVYDIPYISYPESDYGFSLTENLTSYLNFTSNHSCMDNLTYYFYINNTLRYNVSFVSNNSNLTWEFRPNFTDETYGENYTLELLVLNPTYDYLNYSKIWNITINHTNQPVSFSGYIGDKGPVSYNTNIEINLSSYFEDTDAFDVYYNQTMNFTIDSDANSSGISSSVSSWIMTLSASTSLTEVINITTSDNFSNATSNSFSVQFTTPDTTPVPSSGGGGGGSGATPISFNLILPDPVSAYKNDRIVLPITLENTGRRPFSGIDFSSFVAKNGTLRDDISVEFNPFSISSLSAGEKINLTMIINTATPDEGLFEITINATSKSPSYSDWGKLFLTIKEGDDIGERIVFTEQFIEENPECIELKEVVDEAKGLFERGQNSLAIQKAEEAINACKMSISQQGRAKTKETIENKIYRYLLIAAIFDFLFSVLYYAYNRIRLRRGTHI